MINHSLNDATQTAILPELKQTEKLITYAIKKETGQETDVEITAMPDLGLANNAIRMRGGFFTGMFVQWESRIPFIPVDSTINSCGVSVFSLRDEITQEQFIHCISQAKEQVGTMGYNWNFERGNHFISLCRLPHGQQCIVMHASADEYKKSIVDKSLYPVPGVWYYDKIKVVFSPDNRDRYLRYLAGTDAERFAKIAVGLESVNHSRMSSIADLAFGNFIKEELLFVPHYGMPSPSSVAIGCAWKSNHSILLTRPQEKIYIIRPSREHMPPVWLTPHGLGACIPSPKVSYSCGTLYINGVRIETDEDVRRLRGKGIRMLSANCGNGMSHIEHILGECGADIDTELTQIVSLSHDGFVKN